MATRKKTTNQNDQADPNIQEAKKAVLDRALHDIVKKYGEGSIMGLEKPATCRWNHSRPARSRWIWRSASVASQKHASQRS